MRVAGVKGVGRRRHEYLRKQAIFTAYLSLLGYNILGLRIELGIKDTIYHVKERGGNMCELERVRKGDKGIKISKR